MKISEKQIEQVNSRIKALISAGSFYGRKLAAAGISRIDSAEDFEKLPFSFVIRNYRSACYHSIYS